MRCPPILITPLVAALLGFSFAPTEPAQAQMRLSELSPTEAYRNCIIEIQKNAEDGFETAIAWRDDGGGPPALHCIALALFDMGQLAEAAKRLEELADMMTQASDAERASVLGQAGRVWLQLHRLDRAYTVLSKSLKLDDKNPELWIERGEVLARSRKFWDAIDDFSAALDRTPGHVDALIFRAAAYRLLDVNNLARDDIDRVLDTVPEHPDALVELGAIYAKTGALEKARAVWVQVLSLVPDSSAGQAARSGLEQMDVKIE